MKSVLKNVTTSKLPDKNLSFNVAKKPFVIRTPKKRNAMESTVVPNNSKETVELFKVPEEKVKDDSVLLDHTNATGDGPIQPINLRCLNCERMAKNFLFLEDMIKTRGMSSAPKKSCHTCLSALNYLQWLNQIIRNVFQDNAKCDPGSEKVEAEKVCSKKLIVEQQSTKPMKKIKKKPTPILRQTKLIKAKIVDNMKNGLRSHDGILDKPKFRAKKQNLNENPKFRSKAKY